MVENYQSFYHTCIGASHIKNKTVCQDASVTVNTDYLHLLCVCDGHGGSDYVRSHRGSQFAVDAFVKCVKDENFCQSILNSKTVKQREMHIYQLIKSILFQWHSLIEEDYSNHPFTETELEILSDKARMRYLKGERLASAYGTTLIGAILCENFWIGIQIGDGSCTVFSDDAWSEPIPWDDNCFLNVTTSMCDETAFFNFRYFYSANLPDAIILCSDGIDDCFSQKQRQYAFYDLILSSFKTLEHCEARVQLIDYLPQLSEKGSGDDMSIAILLKGEKM